MDKINLFGTDPEYFVVEYIDGKPYSVPVPFFVENGLLPEIGFDEERKHPVVYKCNDFKIMGDGVAFEANPTPSKTPKEMYEKIQNVLNTIREMVSPFGYEVLVSPTVYYDYARYYRREIRSLEWCGLFGCDADKDAILGDEYTSPEIDVSKHIYRYGGGHFHLSDLNKLIKDYPMVMIRLLAMTVGVSSIVNSTKPIEEKLRMFKYGQPGRYRVQDYPDGNIGVEYRSPSNLWTEKLETIEEMFYWGNKAYELLQNPEEAVNRLDNYLDLSVQAITNVDKELGSFILSKM